MSSSYHTFDYYVSAFDNHVTLEFPAQIISGYNPFSAIQADAVATFPIGLSVLRAIFQFGGDNVTFESEDATAIMLLRAPAPATATGNSDSIIKGYVMSDLEAAVQNENGAAGGGDGASYLYLNPSRAMLPLNYSALFIPTAVNGQLVTTTSVDITSINNSGGTTTNPKGPQIVYYPDGTQLPETQQLLKYDFLRYLSRNIFNSPYGVNLFTNQTELMDSMDTQCQLQLVKINAALPPSSTDANALCTNVVSVMYKNHPERFTRNNQVEPGSNFYYVPFQPGDTLRHLITVAPAQDQMSVLQSTLLHMINLPASIPARRYEIIWRVMDDSQTSSTPVPIRYGIVPTDSINVPIPF